jgi:hypothetical protein
MALAEIEPRFHHSIPPAPFDNWSINVLALFHLKDVACSGSSEQLTKLRCA